MYIFGYGYRKTYLARFVCGGKTRYWVWPGHFSGAPVFGKNPPRELVRPAKFLDKREHARFN